MKFLDSMTTGRRMKRLADQYAETFSGPAANAVLQDMAEVCKAVEPVLADDDGKVDINATLANAGRQAVYIHIRNMLRLANQSLEDIEAMFDRQDENL